MNAVPFVPEAVFAEVIVGAFELIVMVSVWVVVPELLSVIVTVTLVVPADVGVPEIVDPLKAKPAGKVFVDQVYVGAPPAPVRLCVSATPTEPDFVFDDVMLKTFAGVPGDCPEAVPFPALLTARILI